MTGERGKKGLKKRQFPAVARWLAPRLRLAVFIGAFRRRKNLSVCVVRVLMQYPSPWLALFFPELYSTNAGDSQQEGQGRRQVLIAERLFQVLPKWPRLAAAHAGITCRVSAPRPSHGCHGWNNTYRIVIHECEKSWSEITISVITCDAPTS